VFLETKGGKPLIPLLEGAKKAQEKERKATGEK
jgi:hypothetical protein